MMVRMMVALWAGSMDDEMAAMKVDETVGMRDL